uniref:SEC63 domain-containing protein n=1 Tax=Craspedostauros australis TaxID=1486917 RepID=A0A7R9WQT7_9STRA
MHAESFTPQKIAMYQKQGIPPQIALQSYRESWWFLVRAERLDGPAPKTEMKINTNGILQAVKEEDLAKFKSATFEDQLITAWPMVVQNVAQKSGRVGINFLSPTDPGKYKFTVIVKSQDFLGADQEFDVTGTVIDGTGITRKPKEKKEAGDKKNKEEEKEEKDGKKEEPAAKKE